MPASVANSGTQLCTVDTLHQLVSSTGPTGGGNFALALDVSALTAGQYVEVEVQRAVLPGGTQRLWNGAPVTLGFGQGWADSPVFRIPAGVAYTVSIRQVGASGGRSIAWSWERIDG